MLILSSPRRISRDNDVAALTPQLWAQESVALLTENMQIAGTIHRDFEDDFSRFGDTVNTRQPANFTAKRKNKSSNVQAEDAVLNNIPVVLNQHIYHSFLLDDSDLTLSRDDLIQTFVTPAAIALARMVDQVCLMQAYQFRGNQVGTLGGLSATNGNALLAKTRGAMNGQLVPDDGRRYLALGHAADAMMMENAIFTEADKRGDVEGLTYGYLGTKQGLHTFMSQNTPSLLALATIDGAVDNAGGYAAGTTVLTVDTFNDTTLKCVAGDWVTIGGNLYHVTAVNAAPATEITISPGLKAAVANDAVIKRHGQVTVDLGAGYAAGWAEPIVFNAPTTAPQVGQCITFGASTETYAIVQTNGSTTMLLDRPLAASVANDVVGHLGADGGGINFAYHRNCMTLALRPLAAPRGGVEAATTSWNGVPMRAVITYDGLAQKQRVTLDFLAGIKVLDEDLATAVLS